MRIPIFVKTSDKCLPCGERDLIIAAKSKCAAFLSISNTKENQKNNFTPEEHGNVMGYPCPYQHASKKATERLKECDEVNC